LLSPGGKAGDGHAGVDAPPVPLPPDVLPPDALPPPTAPPLAPLPARASRVIGYTSARAQATVPPIVARSSQDAFTAMLRT
jgi:hypothetical protein